MQPDSKSQTTEDEPPEPSSDIETMMCQARMSVCLLMGLAGNPTLTLSAARYAMKGAAQLLNALEREARKKGAETNG